MGRKKNKTKAKAKAVSENGKKKMVYGNKKVYALFINEDKPVSWMEIDPHYTGPPEDEDTEDGFSVDRMPKINSPPPQLRISKLGWCSTLVFDSKVVYFIGGRFLDNDDFLLGNDVDDDLIDDDYYDAYSNKIFTYHLSSHKWEESSSKLNIGRYQPIVLCAGNFIYVIGGTVDVDITNQITNKEHWIECFDLLDDDDNKKTSCQFLPATSAPPDDVFHDYWPLYTFVYKPRNQIVFVMPEAGTYAFNYVSKTWAPLHENITKYAGVQCYKVVVIDHLLFWHYCGVIYAYDLMNNRLVLSQRLNQLKMSCRDPDDDSWGCWVDTTFLQRVGNDTLLLICWDVKDVIGKKLHFYKFQFENLTSNDEEQVSYNNLRLVQIGCRLLSPPGDILCDVVAF